MKRVGNLADKVFTRANVRAAWDAYNRNRPVRLRREFDPRLAAEILDAAKRDFRAILGTPRVKTIREGGKERRLQIPSFRASVAMLMLWNVCAPHVERRIHPQSFAARRGFGGHLLARKCSRFLRTRRKEAKYCLYFDIRKFYAHVDSRIMEDRLSTIFKDARILAMFRAVLESAAPGLPIGYPFSHALANLYLVPLYFLVRSFRGVGRVYVYMDNWTVLARTKSALKRALAAARRWLSGAGCEVKGDWQIYPTSARRVKVCGFALSPVRTPRLYSGNWRRTRRDFARFCRRPSKRLWLSLMSRKGWLMAVNKQYSPVFKTEGGYLWR